MANLFELLINKVRGQGQPQELTPMNRADGVIETQPEFIPTYKTPDIATRKDFNYYNTPEKVSLGERLTGVGNKIQDGLFGKMIAPADTVDTENMQATVNAPVRQGGFLNDLSAGWKDNTQNGFKVDNLLPDENKTWATRLGEGLGTAARFANSPLGRGIITGGIVAATGGNPLQSLVYGGQAGVTNQQNVLKDKVYRERLLDAEKQNIINTTRLDSNDWTNIKAQLDSNAEYVNADDATKEKILSTTAANFLAEKQDKLIADAENSINNIRGYLGDDTFRQVLAAQTMRENADWKRMYYDNQQKQNEWNNQFKEWMAKNEITKAEQARKDKKEEFEYKKGQDAFNNFIKTQELEIKQKQQNQLDKKTQTAINDIDGALKQLDDIEAMVKTNKGATGLVVGGLAKGNALQQAIANKISSQGGVQTRAGIAKLRGTTMHDLAGTAQTLQEQKNLAPFLPDATDSVETILFKLSQLRKELKRDRETKIGGSTGNNSIKIDNTALDAELKRRRLL